MNGQRCASASECGAGGRFCRERDHYRGYRSLRSPDPAWRTDRRQAASAAVETTHSSGSLGPYPRSRAFRREEVTVLAEAGSERSGKATAKILA
jgi:hypothetical protein